MVPIAHVMLAEDDEDDQLIFKQVCRQIDARLQLTIVSDGGELLSLLEHVLPDLLFLDLEMPCKNGLECLIAIRQNPSLQHLPIVVLSSTNKPANVQAAYDMGAHLFLGKSMPFAQCLSSVDAILKMDWSNANAIRNQHTAEGRYLTFS